jgi:hypothetical protein
LGGKKNKFYSARKNADEWRISNPGAQEPEKGDQQPCPFDLFIQMDFICFLVFCLRKSSLHFHFMSRNFFFLFLAQDPGSQSILSQAGKLCIIWWYIRTQERLVE